MGQPRCTKRCITQGQVVELLPRGIAEAKKVLFSSLKTSHSPHSKGIKNPLRGSWLRKSLRFKFRGRASAQKCYYQLPPFASSLLYSSMFWGLGIIFHRIPSIYII